MRLSVLSSFVLVGAVFSSSAAYGIADDLSGYCTDTERTAARAFVAAHWRDVVQEFPFSFKYGGVSSREFLHDWKLERNMKKLDAKRKRWLTFHDQQTSGILGLLPLVKGMPVRLTATLSKLLKLSKHRRGVVVGWTLHPD